MRSMRWLPVTIAASFTGLGFALAFLPRIGAPEDYDPMVAVLTLTLVAVVWYAYFAYQQAKAASITAESLARDLRERQGRDVDTLRSFLRPLLSTMNSHTNSVWLEQQLQKKRGLLPTRLLMKPDEEIREAWVTAGSLGGKPGARVVEALKKTNEFFGVLRDPEMRTDVQAVVAAAESAKRSIEVALEKLDALWANLPQSD